uniref:Uncharacterized protein n=1 Tax=Cyclophora tenuis TaxID=216820 RepID=A0A7S1GKJ1_CYCTE|mmetsp:Transcript_17619/g.29906  ORF Transcript_17619/g.29906 Transcript_17619/m.29906 type:complete len:168 (+) Transcript_17619:198-701(+)
MQQKGEERQRARQAQKARTGNQKEKAKAKAKVWTRGVAQQPIHLCLIANLPCVIRTKKDFSVPMGRNHAVMKRLQQQSASVLLTASLFAVQQKLAGFLHAFARSLVPSIPWDQTLVQLPNKDCNAPMGRKPVVEKRFLVQGVHARPTDSFACQPKLAKDQLVPTHRI